MNNQQQSGIVFAAVAYILWGALPIYWKLVDHVGSFEILMHRVFWSFWFMLLLLFIIKKHRTFFKTLKMMKTHPKQLLALSAASILVTSNWFVYIWAVNTDQMVEASLGYYINPLVSVILGVTILKEKLSKPAIISFILAAVGVSVLTFSYGIFPWVAFTLAITFGVYGLVKKMVKVDAEIGMALETLTLMPISLAFLVYFASNGQGAFGTDTLLTTLLLMGAGAVTATPLLLFTKGAQRIPLYMIGFLQYIAPTLMLILGIFVYKETFTPAHFVAFAFIWLALTVLTVGRTKWFKRKTKTPAQAA